MLSVAVLVFTNKEVLQDAESPGRPRWGAGGESGSGPGQRARRCTLRESKVVLALIYRPGTSKTGALLKKRRAGEANGTRAAAEAEVGTALAAAPWVRGPILAVFFSPCKHYRAQIVTEGWGRGPEQPTRLSDFLFNIEIIIVIVVIVIY